MILKCQRVIYSRLMPDLVVAVYKKSPTETGRGLRIFRANIQTISYLFARLPLSLPLFQLCL